MMWMMNPKASTGTITVMIGSAIKSHPALKASGLMRDRPLIVICRSRKITRNNPVMLIMSFFPMDDLKILAIVACCFCFSRQR